MEEPIVASDNPETALVLPGPPPGPPPAQREPSSDGEESEEGEPPPGAVDPEKCSVGGPGTAGGAAQAPVSFYVHAKDSRDTRVREGGDFVVVHVTPGNAARAGGAKDGQAIVQDNGDGSYTATYSVEARGDYQLSVEINGCAVGGSPFPVFFSPPEEQPAVEAPEVLTDASGAPINSETASAIAALTAPPISIMGADAYAALVEFPEGVALERSVLVGNLNPTVSLEQLAQLFSFSGQVLGCRFAGEGDRFAFVEFGVQRDAEQALTLDKMAVIDRAIRVEPARVAAESLSHFRGTQFAALQLQQIARLHAAAAGSHALAAHVAQMRVAAKQGGAPAPGVQLNDSERQKAASLSAIAALSKRLAGGGGGGGGRPAERARSPSPRPGKRRRTVSPTIRYRRRSRSRSPRRRRSSPPPRRRTPPAIRLRSRSRGRRDSRRGSRDRSRSRDRQRDSRDGRRRSSVGRRRGASRERSRDRREPRARSRSRSRSRGRRGGSRERRRSSVERRPERSRERSHNQIKARGAADGGRRSSAGAASDRDRPARPRSREARRERTPFWEPREQGAPSPAPAAGEPPADAPSADAPPAEAPAQPGPEEGAAANGGDASASASQAAEAQELRQKALQALASLGGRDGGAAEEPAGAALAAEETAAAGGKAGKKDKKERKEKKHKKEKKRRRQREGSEPGSD